MERRGFLKSVFGAAIVASIPTVVFSQIENQAPPPPPNNKLPFPTNNHTREGLLYIYNDTELVAQSTLFRFDYKQDIQELQGGAWEKVWTGKYTKKKGKKKYKWIFVPSEYPEYKPGLKQWSVESDYIQWLVDPDILLMQNVKLKCLIKQADIKITGEVFISQLYASVSSDLVYAYSARFDGTGICIMEYDK